jgi:hypothetical protein
MKLTKTKENGKELLSTLKISMGLIASPIIGIQLLSQKRRGDYDFSAAFGLLTLAASPVLMVGGVIGTGVIVAVSPVVLGAGFLQDTFGANNQPLERQNYSASESETVEQKQEYVPNPEPQSSMFQKITLEKKRSLLMSDNALSCSFTSKKENKSNLENPDLENTDFFSESCKKINVRSTTG